MGDSKHTKLMIENRYCWLTINRVIVNKNYHRSLIDRVQSLQGVNSALNIIITILNKKIIFFKTIKIKLEFDKEKLIYLFL